MENKQKVPEALQLTSVLSASLTIALSCTYIVLSLLGVIFRFDCNATSSDSTRGADHFINMIHRVYIQQDSCSDSLSWPNVTSADSVFTLNIITLCASAVTLLVAAVLITVVKVPEYAENLSVTVYVYVGACVASLVVDLTFATHFGMDYTYLSEQMNPSSPGMPLNYDRDMVRLGALLFMALALKGFVAHLMNLILQILLIIYVIKYQQSSRNEEHSIHKLGTISAYDRTRRQEPWQSEPPIFLNNHRGPQTNPAFVDDTLMPPRSPKRERNYSNKTNGSDISSSRGINRSDSWQPGAISGSRPFSYLEEPKRAAAAPEPQWRRDWQPPVPAPDYSPQTPRRLKSALKPSYM